MRKAMIFIDGTWLYCNTPRLAAASGHPDFHLDFGKLPCVLADEVRKQLGDEELDVVRTCLFGSYATNCDPRDDDARQRRLDFFARLREDYHYELEIFPINFLGRRLKRSERDPEDPFEPREKCVDISLATSMLTYAALPNAYDIAIAVIGDADFKPVLQSVRKLGKRVAIASIHGSCSPEFADPRDESRLKDFHIIWLDQLLDRLALRFDPHELECESPMHKGDRRVMTTFHPRRGQQFFCEPCREAYARSRECGRELPCPEAESPCVGTPLEGTIVKKVADRGFGFIHATDGRDYFFHLADLCGSLPFETVEEGLAVRFEVKREPAKERGGTAMNIRRLEAATAQ